MRLWPKRRRRPEPEKHGGQIAPPNAPAAPPRSMTIPPPPAPGVSVLSVIDHREPRAEVVHASPPDYSGLMPCCNRTPVAVPPYHRMTLDPELVTCKPLRFLTGQQLAAKRSQAVAEQMPSGMDAGRDWVAEAFERVARAPKVHYLPAVTAGKCTARPASPDHAVSETGAVTCGMCKRTVLYKTAATGDGP